MTEQPSVEMFLISRADIKEIRLALLYARANPKNKVLAEKTEKMFFAAHERLTAILKTVPQTVLGTPGERQNTEPSNTNTTTAA